MKIGSTKENLKFEKRIAITPDIVKKYINLGFELFLSENYGTHLGITDNEFKELGVTIFKNDKEIINSSDLIVQMGLLSEENESLIKEGQSIVGVLNPYINKKKIRKFSKKKNKSFFFRIIASDN